MIFVVQRAPGATLLGSPWVVRLAFAAKGVPLAIVLAQFLTMGFGFGNLAEVGKLAKVDCCYLESDACARCKTRLKWSMWPKWPRKRTWQKTFLSRMLKIEVDLFVAKYYT